MLRDSLDGASTPTSSCAHPGTALEQLVRTVRPRRDLTLLDGEMGALYRDRPQSGLWTANLMTGLVYWSAEVYAIYGFEPGDGPIDFAAAMRCYPDEANTVLYDLIDRATSRCCGFRFVLPLLPVGATRRITIATIAAYRGGEDGTAEIFGVVAPVEKRPLELALRG